MKILSLSNNILVNKCIILFFSLLVLIKSTLINNEILDAALVGFLIFSLLFKIFPHIFFILIVFETVLDFPLLGGSLVRVYNILFLFYMVINSTRINIKSYFPFLVIYFLLIFTELRYNVFNLQGIISSVVILTIMSLLHKSVLSRKLMLFTFITTGLCIVYYGLCNLEWIYIGRFYSVVKDPNYTAFLLFPGYIASMSLNVVKSKLVIIIFLIFLIAILFTSSLTALFSLLIVTYLKFKYDLNNSILNYFKNYYLVLFIPFILSLFILFGDIFEEGLLLVNRLNETIELLSQSDFSAATSNRSDLFSSYFRLIWDSDLFNFIFGFYPYLTSPDLNSVSISKFDNISHNSYLDVMLYVGLIGLIIVIFFNFSRIKFLVDKFRKADYIYFDLFLIKFSFVIMSASLSLFPFRYFIYFFLI
jgi:hypothetical protein